MPRLYKRKSSRGSLSENDLQKALKAVKEDGIIVDKVSQTFNIPKKALLNNGDKNMSCGPNAV